MKKLQEERNKRIEYRRLANGSQDVRESHEDEEKQEESLNSENNENPENLRQSLKIENIKSTPDAPRKRLSRFFSIFPKICRCFSKYKEIQDSVSTSEKT
jgi:hypothetical protein